jgi:hypothetical protein
MSDRDILGEVRYDVVEEEVEEHTGVDGITEQVLRRPDVLAALQGRLHAEMLEVIVFPLSVKNWFVTWSHKKMFGNYFSPSSLSKHETCCHFPYEMLVLC